MLKACFSGQVAEGEGPDQAGHPEKPGTADDSSTVEVTAPQEPESPHPAEVAEGEESPAEAATTASLDTGAQVPAACLLQGSFVMFLCTLWD